MPAEELGAPGVGGGVGVGRGRWCPSEQGAQMGFYMNLRPCSCSIGEAHETEMPGPCLKDLLPLLRAQRSAPRGG